MLRIVYLNSSFNWFNYGSHIIEISPYYFEIN